MVGKRYIRSNSSRPTSLMHPRRLSFRGMLAGRGRALDGCGTVEIALLGSNWPTLGLVHSSFSSSPSPDALLFGDDPV